MVQDLHFMMRSVYARALEVLRMLPPEKAVVIRHAGLLLAAHNFLATFHRTPEASAIEVKVDYSPENPEDQYEVSARNGFFDVIGDWRSPSTHQLTDRILPLELMSTATFVVQRTDPLVQLSLSDTLGRDRVLHHRLVHQLAVEIDAAFEAP